MNNDPVQRKCLAASRVYFCCSTSSLIRHTSLHRKSAPLEITPWGNFLEKSREISRHRLYLATKRKWKMRQWSRMLLILKSWPRKISHQVFVVTASNIDKFSILPSADPTVHFVMQSDRFDSIHLTSDASYTTLYY